MDEISSIGQNEGQQDFFNEDIAEPKDDPQYMFPNEGEPVAPSFPYIKPRPQKKLFLPQEDIEVQKEQPGNWRVLSEREKKRREHVRTLLLEAAGYKEGPETNNEEEEEAMSTTSEDKREREAQNRAMWDKALQLIQTEAVNHAFELRMLTEEIKAVSEVNWKRHDAAEIELQKKVESIQKVFEDANQKFLENQKVVETLAQELDAMNTPLPEPTPPEKPNLELYEPIKLPLFGKETRKGPVAKIEALIRRINEGQFDSMAVVQLESDLTMDSQQRAQIQAVVDERNKQRESAKSSALAAYEQDQRAFEQSLQYWKGQQQARKGELGAKEKRLKAAKEKLRLFEQGNDSAKALLEWVNTELAAEKDRAKEMWEAASRAEVEMCKQVMEFKNNKKAIERLQLRLEIAVDERERALRMARGAITEQERVELQLTRTKLLQHCRETFAEIRQGLVDEGRRRRWLYSEEQAVVKQELRRVRQEESQINEREDLIVLIDNLMRGEESARQKYLKFRETEISTAKDFAEGGRGLEPSKESNDLFKLWKEEGAKLQSAMTARISACQRQGQLYQILYANYSITTVPAEDFWVPKALHQRHIEQIWEMEELQRDELIRARSFVQDADHRVRIYELVHKRMTQRMADRADAHNKEIDGLKAAFVEGVRVLKPLIEKTRKDLQTQVDQLETALTDLSEEFKSFMARTVGTVDELQSKVSTRDAWIVTLRHEMGREVVRRSVLQDDYLRLLNRTKKEILTLKDELRSERAHSNRVRLWIAAMHADVKHYLYEIRKRELLQQQIAAADEQEKRKLRFLAWKNSAAMYILFTDVDNLFLFFAQRLANLAGARKVYNDRLRDNGALEVLLAISRGPRQDLRVLASRALAGFGWNGFIEHRIVGWDCKRHWQNWVASVIPAREKQMQALRIRFEEEKRKPKTIKTNPRDLKQSGSQASLLSGESLVAADASVHTMFEEQDEEFEASPDMSLRDLIRARRQWALRRARRKESPNPENQSIIGMAEEYIRQLVQLMKNNDWEVVRNAVLSLSIASYDDVNSVMLGGLEDCVKQTVHLLQSSDLETRAHAAAALANMGYGNRKNQELIGDAGGIEILVQLAGGPDLDAIEASVAALANLLCYNDANSVRLIAAGGLEVLFSLLVTDRIANLMDVDQMAEIHANCAETLANATRTYNKEAAERIRVMGYAPLVLLCGASNIQVVRHAALILGNVAQEEVHRQVVGLRGGVEALMLLANHTDRLTQANALWALGNLAWSPENQERIGRYIGEVFSLCSHCWLPVRTSAVVLLANALYFHEGNRVKVEEIDPDLKAVLSWCGQSEPQAVQESALRALISLTYTDRVAVPLPAKTDVLPLLINKISEPASLEIQRFCLMAVINLAVHDINKRKILDAGGVEVLVQCQGSDNEKIRELSRQILDALADITDKNQLEDKRKQFGIRGLFQLLQTDNVPIQKLAAESIAEEVWLDPKKQKEVAECGGIETLLTLARNMSTLEDQVMLPLLWSLRNSIHNNMVNRERASRADGVSCLLSLSNFYFVSRNPKLLEASLTTLINLIMDNERNCRKLIRTGLDILIDIAESYEKGSAGQQTGSSSLERDAFTDLTKTNAALAASVLQIIGPYNFIFCSNCKSKQTEGTSCSQCGHKINSEERMGVTQF